MAHYPPCAISIAGAADGAAEAADPARSLTLFDFFLLAAYASCSSAVASRNPGCPHSSSASCPVTSSSPASTSMKCSTTWYRRSCALLPSISEAGSTVDPWLPSQYNKIMLPSSSSSLYGRPSRSPFGFGFGTGLLRAAHAAKLGGEGRRAHGIRHVRRQRQLRGTRVDGSQELRLDLVHRCHQAVLRVAAHQEDVADVLSRHRVAREGH